MLVFTKRDNISPYANPFGSALYSFTYIGSKLKILFIY